MISVIVPVFNTKQYLERSIESVLHQSYKNWELLLVDDGSSDGSGAVCDVYAGKDSRIRVIHQDNKGAPAARNTGMKHALGGYLLFLDSDDWLYPDTLEVVYDAAVSSGSDMVIFDMQYEGENYSWHEKSKLPKGIYDSETVLENLARLSMPPYACNKFCVRRLYDGIWFPEGEKWTDVATTFYPVSRAKKIAVLGKPLYHYWQREEAISKQAKKDGSIHKWRFIQYRKRYEFLKANYPHLSNAAKNSVLKNGLLYYSICLQGRDEHETRCKVRSFLCSGEFDDGITSKKVKAARGFFKICPSIISLFIRKRFSR